MIAERLQALRTRQATLEGRERELLPRLQLAELERDRTAADIRMGEAWELAIAASRGFSTRLRREADRLARERAATQRAITILEGRLPLAQRVEAAVARAREQALAELQDGDDSPKTASTRGPRQLEAVRQRANRWRWE